MRSFSGNVLLNQAIYRISFLEWYPTFLIRLSLALACRGTAIGISSLQKILAVKMVGCERRRTSPLALLLLAGLSLVVVDGVPRPHEGERTPSSAARSEGELALLLADTARS